MKSSIPIVICVGSYSTNHPLLKGLFSLISILFALFVKSYPPPVTFLSSGHCTDNSLFSLCITAVLDTVIVSISFEGPPGPQGPGGPVAPGSP